MRLFELLEQIDIDLENGYTPEDIRTMRPEDIADLVRFARELGYSARKLTRTLAMAESRSTIEPPTGGGTIDSLDHPVLRKLEEQRRLDREQASRISRRGLHEVTADELIPSEPLVMESVGSDYISVLRSAFGAVRGEPMQEAARRIVRDFVNRTESIPVQRNLVIEAAMVVCRPGPGWSLKEAYDVLMGKV